jgi:DNA repair exonuclease SbcCD ATPase subunit
LEAQRTQTDPYQEQIVEMTTHALEEINYDLINQLKKVQDHEEFLLKLLTNKDSFIRKRIIEQNLNYLNQRLSYYLYKMGLPHRVVFQSDLSVKIEELGRDLDVGNLSRGESTRLILCLSWSFRDVWESLYQPINLLFIDEMIDNGMDAAGVENAMAVLKHMTRERHRSVWLISHKDELASRVNNVLKVIKENGFTQYLQETA